MILWLVACRATPSPVSAVEEAELRVAGQTLHATLYQNADFACGRQGDTTFALIERDSEAQAPLWVFLPGGGVGYYGEDAYHPAEEEALNDAPDLDALLREVRRVAGEHAERDTLLAGALREGWRVLVPALCDHDLYAGEGQIYPNNAGNTVDGLLATAAALAWVEAGDARVDPRPSEPIVLHGMSAGAVGAHALAYRREEEGRPVQAAILDSLLWSEARDALQRAGCTPQQRAEPGFDWAAVGEKIGAFVQDPALYPEAALPWSETPRFNLYATGDPACCGDRALLPEAAGAASNCAWAYRGFDENAAAPNGVYAAEMEQHGLSEVEGPWQAAVRAWLDAAL